MSETVKLTGTRVKTTDTDSTRSVDFETDHGIVEICDLDGDRFVQIDFEDASVDDARAILDDVADSEHFDADAEALARDILTDIEAATDSDPADNDDEGDDSPTTTSGDDAEVVYVTDDGTEVRVGDEINHPGGWTYEIRGREDDYTLRKHDRTDDWGVTESTVERDIRDHGFARRVETEEA